MTYNNDNIYFLPVPTHGNAVNLHGLQFGYLTILGITRYDSRKRSVWLAECQCGMFTEAVATQYTSGCKTSCGCRQREVVGALARTHALSKTPEYIIWKRIRSRCNTPTCTDYPRYGGRGVMMTYQGITKPLAAWCDDMNLRYDFLYNRLHRGWTPEEAMTTPFGTRLYSRERKARLAMSSKRQIL